MVERNGEETISDSIGGFADRWGVGLPVASGVIALLKANGKAVPDGIKKAARGAGAQKYKIPARVTIDFTKKVNLGSEK